MKNLILILITICSFNCYSQYKITGNIKDETTKLPLEFCNIFINGTSIGTNTDSLGNFSLVDVPFIEVELVISYVGYKSFNKSLNFSKTSEINIKIELKPLENQLSGIQVKGSVDKTWEKQLKKFRSEFLGSNEFNKKCKIENAYVLDFVEKDGVLSAKAKEPLKILNMALGYELSFEIKEFETSKTSFKIYGNVLFKEMKALNKESAEEWQKNREMAYFKSMVFFFKSILNKQLDQNGFELYVERPGNLSKRSDNLSLELTKSLMKYETESLVGVDKHPTLKTINLPDNIEIHNNLIKSSLRTYLDYSNAVSWMSLANKSIRVNTMGVPVNPSEIMVSGDMNYFKVAGLLPLNFATDQVPASEN